MTKEPIILGIETSCDETAVSILKGKNELLANMVVSQIDIHKIFGGVVPEIASRKHVELLYKLTKEAFTEASITPEEIDAIAVTHGPGLVGALLIGLNFAKGLSLLYNKPLIGVNHLMGHIYANFLAIDNLEPPFIVLLVSGGHTMLMEATDYMDFKIIGQTRDDSVGESFDKVARILNLEYPGGPVIDKLSRQGAIVHKFPKPLYDDGYDFSFSGLKTSVLYYSKEHPETKMEDLACSFQEAIIDTIVHKTIKYAKESGIKKIVIAGGVAANSLLREKLDKYNNKYSIFYPPMKFCTDNSAMIARAGYEKYIRGMFSDLSIDAVPYLSINEL